MSKVDASVCPYCNNPTQYTDSAVVYGRSYGMIYACLPCQAWVGVHKGTDRALGRLANSELRELKKAAHSWFDPLWRKKVEQGFPKQKARGKAYKWLAQQMGIEPKDCHIGMFDENSCRLVIEICSKVYLRKATTT
jgi:hypothetical protein